MAKSSKRIATHSGKFHCDEAFACWMLKNTNEFRDADIIRTRDPTLIDASDIVVDVGGVYDPARHRYDHHQRGFTETLNDKYKTKLSSAGLVYKHFGKEVLANVLGDATESTIDLLHDRMYKKFVESLDAVDNGISQYAAEDGVQERYEVTTTLPSRVNLLNPFWNESVPEGAVQERFLEAVALTGREFRNLLDMYHRAWLPARTVVERAVKTRCDVHGSGRIVLLDQRCPWGDHLASLEQEHGLEGEQSILYVVFGDRDDWRVQAVPVAPHSFESRLALAEQWRGVRDDELSSKTGIDGCVFVHASGFIGGTKSKDSALALARLSMQLQGK